MTLYCFDWLTSDQKKNGYVRVVPHSEKKGNDKVQFSSPETGDENVKKRKTEWLLL